MKAQFKKENNLSKQTELQFGENVNPTTISPTQFNKLFTFNRSIGEGTFGSVRCVTNCYGDSFAIKQSKDNQQTYGVYRQAAIMKKFNHPNILKFIVFYQIKETKKLILLTEFCKYKSLKDFMAIFSPLEEYEKYRLAVEIFCGLYALHQKNIMHRDLKPDNILIDQNKRSKICDFGFCRYDGTDDFAKSRKVGTPLYNPPEIERGMYSKKCDIFSYGLIVYFIFSNGKNLFKKTTTNEELKIQKKQFLRNEIKTLTELNFPNDIIQLLQNTLTDNQKNRFDTMAIKAFWMRVLRQKNMAQLIDYIEESERINNYQKPVNHQQGCKQNYIDVVLSNQQKLASQLIRYDSSNAEGIQVSQKVLKLIDTITGLSQIMKEFKTMIEEVNLPKVEKQLITYGFLYQLELRMETVFSEGIKIYSFQRDIEIVNITDSLQSLLSSIMKKRHKIIPTILKIGHYLQMVRYLLKPDGLLQPIKQSFSQLGKLQEFCNETCSIEKVESLKVSQQIHNNKDFYQLIEAKYKTEISLAQFTAAYSIILAKYRNALGKDNKLIERQKVDNIFKKLQQI